MISCSFEGSNEFLFDFKVFFYRLIQGREGELKLLRGNVVDGNY